MSSFWDYYYEHGIIPNIWKGITGQKSADLNTDKSNAAQLAATQSANNANLQIAQETNATNKEIAEQNLGFQRDLFEYNKALQQQQWEREDTSYQRTKADMLSAGLNPLSMQGTNGAGEVVSQTAPQNNFQAQTGAPMQAAQLNAYQSKIMSTNEVISALGSVADSINGIMTGIHQRDGLQLQNDKQRLDNAILAHDYGIDLFGTGSNRSVAQSYIGNNDFGWNRSKGWKNDFNYGSSNSSWYSGANAEREYLHKNDIGIFDTDLREERILTALEDWIGNGRMKKLFDTMKEQGLGLLTGLWKTNK